jgi:glucosamine-6-phosphate deaminase
MRLIITKHNLGLFASCYVMDKINKHDFLKKKQFVLGLPTGGTAEDMYKHLVLFYKQKMISLSSLFHFSISFLVVLSVYLLCKNKLSYNFFL